MKNKEICGILTESYNMLNEITIIGDVNNIALALSNEKIIRQAILSKYPTSDMLKQRLILLGTKKSLRIASMLPEGMPAEEYVSFINKHFGGRTFWRWLGVVLGQEISLWYQTLKARGIIARNNPDEFIADKVY